MRIRIAIGVVFGLAAAFAFVFLQFRAEAMAQQTAVVEDVAQQVSPEVVPADSISPFGSSQISSNSDAELPTLSEPAGTTSVFAEDVNAGTEAPATSDPFGDDTPPTHSASGIEVVEPEGADYDPFSSTGAELPSEPFDTVDAFASDFESGSDEFSSPMKEQPLRIIRLRTVRAVEVRAIIENLFHENVEKQRWFLSTENQSNSLIFKGPASEFDQFKKLASELDRMAETPVNPRKKTVSWPIAHAFDDSPETASKATVAHWPIRIIRLRHLNAEDFTGIARELAESQNSETKLRIFLESATNSVVVRGPTAETRQVEQLAQQLDQPAAGAGGGEFMDSTFDSSEDSENLDVFITNEDSGWQEFDGPTVQPQRMREYVAHHDQQSVALASEIRSLRRKYSSNHPKLAEARQKLEDVLEASFKLRLQLQGLEVAAIKSKLADIESRVQRRSQLRQQIITRRLHELLGEKDDLSWEVARTGPALPSRSLDDLLPSSIDTFDPRFADFRELVPNDDAAEGELVPPTPYAGEVEDVASTGAPRVPPMPVAEFPIRVESDSETVLRNLPELDIEENFESADGAISAETPVSSRRPELPGVEADTQEQIPPDVIKPILNEGVSIVGRPSRGSEPETPGQGISLTGPTRIRGATYLQELIVAEHAVEVSRLKVDRIESQLSKLKDSDQAEDLEYELRLAELALDQARKLLEQKHRWIAAQRNSHVVNIRYLEKSVALAESEFLLMIETHKKAPGSVATAEVRRQQLEIQKAKLRLEQAEADLDVFEVENRTSRNSGTPLRSIEDSRSFRKPVIDEPQPVSRNRAVDDAIGIDVAVEPEISLPEIEGPGESLKPSSSPETPTVVPEPDSNPVRSS